MQIGANVNDKACPSYQSTARPGRSAGDAKNDGGSFRLNEEAKAPDFIEKLENYQDFIRERKAEILEKIQKGDTEPAFQTGAQSFTEKEWDEFLEKFDAVEDTIRELMREEHEKRKEEMEEQKKIHSELLNSKDSDLEDMLLSEMTMCSCPASDPDKEDVRYITWYTEEGIFCRKAGQSAGYEWHIAFENPEQYDKVMELVGQFSADENLRFAAHENFWTDFLDDKIDMQNFMLASADDLS